MFKLSFPRRAKARFFPVIPASFQALMRHGQTLPWQGLIRREKKKKKKKKMEKIKNKNKNRKDY